MRALHRVGGDENRHTRKGEKDSCTPEKSNVELQYDPVSPRVEYTQNRQWDWNSICSPVFTST